MYMGIPFGLFTCVLIVMMRPAGFLVSPVLLDRDRVDDLNRGQGRLLRRTGGRGRTHLLDRARYLCVKHDWHNQIDDSLMMLFYCLLPLVIGEDSSW